MENNVEKENRVDRFHFVTMDSLKQEESAKEDIIPREAVIPAEVTAPRTPEPVVELKPEAEVESQTVETAPIPKKEVNPKWRFKFHISFEHRVAIAAATIFFTFIAACLLIYNTILSSQGETITYQESNSIHYMVCVFASNECLEEEQEYLVLDTNSIKAQFQYQADFPKDVEYHLDYYVKALWKVYDGKKSNEILLKMEDLLFEETKASSIGNQISIDATVTVDYQKYYNKFLEVKRNFTDEEITADLEMVLYLNGKTGTRKISSLLIPMSADSYRVIKNVIPKSEGSVKVTTDFWNVHTILNAVIASILIGVCLFVLYKTVKLILAVTAIRSKYQQKLLKILRDYDRIIVIARGGYESNFVREVVDMNTFEELLEKKRSLQKPIIYSKVNDVKSEFIVEDECVLYKYTIKESDV